MIVSTRASLGERDDQVTAVIAELARRLGFACLPAVIVADGEPVGAALTRLLRQEPPAIILTSGGTGLTPDDLAPEYTRPLLEKEIPGIMEALRRHGADHNPLAVLSRGVAGVAGGTVIINLPGSPRAVQEASEVLEPILPHLCDQVADLRPSKSWGGHHHE